MKDRLTHSTQLTITINQNDDNLIFGSTSDYGYFVTEEGNLTIAININTENIEIKTISFSSPIVQVEFVKNSILYVLDANGYIWKLSLFDSFIPEIFRANYYLAQSIRVQNGTTYLCIVGFDCKTIWIQSEIDFNRFSIGNGKIINNVSCGSKFVYVICDDNSIWSMGNNEFGQLGLKNYRASEQFKQIKSKKCSNIISISCGNSHALFLTNENTVYSCGNNRKGQLGLNSEAKDKNKFCLLSNLALIYKILCQNNKSFCLDCDGNVFAFGDIFGNKPMKIDNLPPIRYIHNNNKSIRTLFIDINNDLWILKFRPTSSITYHIQKLDERFNGICGNNSNLESELIKNKIQLRRKEYVSISIKYAKIYTRYFNQRCGVFVCHIFLNLCVKMPQFPQFDVINCRIKNLK